MVRTIRSRKARWHATLLLEPLEVRCLLDGDPAPWGGFDPETGLPPFPYDEVDRLVMYDDLRLIDDPIGIEHGVGLLDGLNLFEATAGANGPALPEEGLRHDSNTFPLDFLDREFMVFDNMSVVGKPDLIDGYGLQPIQLFTNSFFWKPGDSISEPNLEWTRKFARYIDPRWMFVVDIEHWPTYGDEAVVAESIRKLALVVDTIKEVNPQVVTGIYGMMPVRDYWTPVANGYDSPQFDAWAARNARLQELADHVDVIVPSLYTFYPDYDANGTPRLWERDRWVQYATANLLQAQQYGKPVVPYVWPLYHGGGGSDDPNSPNYRYWKYQPIGGEFWRLILDTVHQYSDSTVIWEGLQRSTWNDQAPWWQATQDFLAEVLPARAQGEATVSGQVTVGDWRDTRSNDNGTVTITVGDTNVAPIARNDRFPITTRAAVTLNVLADNGSGADSDVDGTLVASATELVSGPSKGAVTNNRDGTFTYVPSSSFSGSDSFTYRVRDNDYAYSNAAIVTIAWNSPPLAKDDSISVTEDTPLTINVLLNNGLGADSDVDGNLNSASTALVSGPAFGTVVRNADGTFRYSPSLNFRGSDSFRYTVADMVGAVSNVATVTITINSVADQPSVTSTTTKEDAQSTSGLVISRNVADGNEVTHFKITNITNGTLYKHDGVTLIPDGTFITFAEGQAGLKFTPAANFNGSGHFTVQASNSNQNSGLAGSMVVATVTVLAVNDAPVAKDDEVVTRIGQSILVDVLRDNGHGPDHDIDGILRAHTTTVVDGPGAGFLINRLDGTLLYLPAPGFAGTVSFSYTIWDDDGASSGLATVTITVSNMNSAPVARGDVAQTEGDTPLIVNVLLDSGSGADYDPDGTLVASTTVAVSGPSHGTLTNLGDGSFRYTPAPGFSGMDGFAYTVRDNAARRVTRPRSRSRSRRSTTPRWPETTR